MTQTVDYYFALISPWSYLGFRQFLAIARESGTQINYKPVDLGLLFPETGGLPLAKRHPSRQAYRLQELARWKARLGRELNLQPAYFPADDSLAKKTLVVVERAHPEKLPDLIEAYHRIIWAEERNIADEAVVRDVLHDLVLPDPEIILSAKSPAAADTVQATSAEAVARGVFGVPSYCLRDEIFWGQDRLDFLREALTRG